MKELDIGTVLNYRGRELMVVYDPTWLLTGKITLNNMCRDCALNENYTLNGGCTPILNEIFGEERPRCESILGKNRILVDRPAEEACDERNG